MRSLHRGDRRNRSWRGSISSYKLQTGAITDVLHSVATRKSEWMGASSERHQILMLQGVATDAFGRNAWIGGVLGALKGSSGICQVSRNLLDDRLSRRSLRTPVRKLVKYSGSEVGLSSRWISSPTVGKQTPTASSFTNIPCTEGGMAVHKHRR